MATFLILGTYTNKGAKGLVEKNSDRREAMKTLADSVGAKFIDYSITRGIYDFWILIEADNYDQIAAINLKAKSADTIDKADVLETVDINRIRQEAISAYVKEGMDQGLNAGAANRYATDKVNAMGEDIELPK